MKDNKNTVIVLVVIIVVLVTIIVGLLLKNSKDNKDTNTTTIQNVATDDNATLNDNNIINTDMSFYSERYANLTQEEINTFINERTMDEISVAVREGSITNTGLVLDINDKNEIPYSYHTKYITIEKLENNEWKEVKTEENYKGLDKVYYSTRDGNLNLPIDWDDKYGILGQGHYKLNLGILQGDSSIKTVSVEFDIQ